MSRWNYDRTIASDRRRKTADLYMRHMSQGDIAKELGVSQARVSMYISEIQAEWRKSMLHDWDTMKLTELQRLNRLEATYWEGWERSLREAETNVRESGERPIRYEDESGRLKVQKFTYAKDVLKRESTNGDPRFLDGIQKCIERRCQMFGLDAPKVVDIEMRVREAAIAEGLDAEAAVEEARRLIGLYGAKSR